jgi:hypothetical protein
MRRWATLLRLLVILSALLSGLASPAWAAKYLAIDQMEQLLVQLGGKPEAPDTTNFQVTNLLLSQVRALHL